MQKAIDRFQRRIGELETFDPTTVKERSDPRISTIEVAIDEALSEAFGQGTSAYRRYSSATNLDRASLNYLHGTPLPDVIMGLQEGKAGALALLKQAIRSFEEKLADFGEEVSADAPRSSSASPSTEIFIVHGHDHPAMTELASLIERAGLTPVILHKQPNAGRTIIEKFEDHGGSAGFAVVLLTPDDVGGPANDKLQPRARQNVIGEMFWSAGKLGRKRVCALKKGNIEIPSDFFGVLYTEMDETGAWKTELLRELEAANYKVNWRALA